MRKTLFAKDGGIPSDIDGHDTCAQFGEACSPLVTFTCPPNQPIKVQTTETEPNPTDESIDTVNRVVKKAVAK